MARGRFVFYFSFSFLINLTVFCFNRNYKKKCVTFGSPQVTFSKLTLPELFSLVHYIIIFFFLFLVSS